MGKNPFILSLLIAAAGVAVGVAVFILVRGLFASPLIPAAAGLAGVVLSDLALFYLLYRRSLQGKSRKSE